MQLNRFSTLCDYFRVRYKMATTKSIVLQGDVKILTGPRNSSTWKNSRLTLFADASVEYEVDGAKTVLPIGPSVTTTKSIKANYAQVFVINTVLETDYGSGPTFCAADEKAADEWIKTINCTRAIATSKAKHPHPLTSVTTTIEESQIGITATSIHVPDHLNCNVCNKSVWEGLTCEFCDNYVVCVDCDVVINAFAKSMVKSPTHEHPLMGFPRAAADGLFFNNDYNGYNCDQCQAQGLDGEVYHCIECGIYDECPTCAKAALPKTLTLGATAQFLGNFVGSALNGGTPKNNDCDINCPTHLELKHLASAMEVTNSTMSLKEGAKVPRGMSMMSNQPWDLSQIEAEPVPNAYMEITFNKFVSDSDNFVGIGIGNQIWAQNQMLGLQQNSYGYFNDGTIAHNTTYKEEKYFPGFQAGDTIGVGVLYDSFNSRRLFFTKNGAMVGNFPSLIHKGMDCFPGVSFTNQSQVSFSVNMTGPFKFDTTKSILNYRDNRLDYMSTVPAEIVAGIISYTVTKPIVGLEMRLVNKIFSQLACDNQIWKPLFLAKWPMQHSNLKLKSWFTLYKRRHVTAAKPGVSSDISFIENCDFEFQCPLLWEAMKKGKTENERFCDKCQKTVYSVSDENKLREYAMIGRCVSFVREIKPAFPRPQQYRMGGAPRPPPRVIPPSPK